MSRLPQPGEHARILASEVMDRIGATGRWGVVLDRPSSMLIHVELDDPSGVPWDMTNTPGANGVIWCTISEIELVAGGEA